MCLTCYSGEKQNKNDQQLLVVGCSKLQNIES